MNDLTLHRAKIRTSVITALALGVGCLGLVVREVSGQPESGPTLASDCKRCHTCETPTTENVCLPLCTRSQAAAERLAGMRGPSDIILLDMLKGETEGTDYFGPVPFDHAGHAAWAEIAGGCTDCHHYTPAGANHPECRTCHPLQVKREDLSKPSLKGAYHRQCMGCHREWTHDTKCGECHIPRLANGSDQPTSLPGVPRDRLHAPIPEPEMEIYETGYPEGAGSKVYFHHKRHTVTYGFKCAECHKGDTCARCHEPGKKHTQRVITPAQHHEACSACHQTEAEGKCDHCHRRAGQPEPAPFNHADTGWPLKPYHGKKGCLACHKSMPFAKLDRNCGVCHTEWDPDEFDHAVTGQILDENHEDADCADCHMDGRYDRPPACDECHDVDEGFVFPGKRPGPTVAPEKKAGQAPATG